VPYGPLQALLAQFLGPSCRWAGGIEDRELADIEEEMSSNPDLDSFLEVHIGHLSEVEGEGCLESLYEDLYEERNRSGVARHREVADSLRTSC
jgi:hypothetical protein